VRFQHSPQRCDCLGAIDLDFKILAKAREEVKRQAKNKRRQAAARSLYVMIRPSIWGGRGGMKSALPPEKMCFTNP